MCVATLVIIGARHLPCAATIMSAGDPVAGLIVCKQISRQPGMRHSAHQVLR